MGEAQSVRFVGIELVRRSFNTRAVGKGGFSKMAQPAMDWAFSPVGLGVGLRPLSEPAWQRAHGELVRLARHRAGLDEEEGRWLLAALREGTHVRLGFGSFGEYAERMFGYGRRFTQEKLRVAEALETLPSIAQELRTGALNFSVVRELTRVATRDTESDWLEVARGKTVREVEQLVSGRRPGSRPDDRADPQAKRHILRFEVTGEVLATFREALGKIRRESSEPLDDDTALLLMSRYILGGARDEGHSSYQIALTVCERCKAAQQHGRGELVNVGDEIVAMAACDAQNIGWSDGASQDMAKDDEVPPSTGKLEDASAADGRLEDSAHVDVDRRARDQTQSRARATQSIPPTTRRKLLRRDVGRCRVPGCRHAVFVDAHHLETRGEGGRHHLENLVTLCGAHHRAVHRGELIIEGTASGELTFRHGDGRRYGNPDVSPTAAAVYAKAFQALKQQGFRDGEIRKALSSPRVRAESALDKIFRAALLELTPARAGVAPDPQ